MRLERLVVGVDFSAASVAAAKWAATHFAPGAELTLVHAVYVPEPPRFLRGRFPPVEGVVENARRGADARLAELAASLPRLGAGTVRAEVRVGRPEYEVARAANVWNADVVVVGRHGERPVPWNALGATAQHLVEISPVPVLLATGLRDVRPRGILVPLTDSDVAPCVLQWVRFLGTRFGASVTALHVIGSAVMAHLLAAAPTVVAGGQPDYFVPPDANRLRAVAEVRGDADRWLAGLLRTDVSRDRATSEVTFGEAGQEILAAAERLGSELIVMGRQREGALRRAILGSVTGEVLRGANCPVLVVGEPEDEIGGGGLGA
ncbi:MAG TPA: universal stress protein [Gemmatimonadaceae bacterium]|nr:universal stress protein [Gemmatimonadaceae bacterium]